jgi:hypothetical protein
MAPPPRIPESYRTIAAQLAGPPNDWPAPESTARGHAAWTAPATGEVIVASGSPSDRRSKRRFVSECRRAGAVIDSRGAAAKVVAEQPGPGRPAAPPPETPAVPADTTAELRELVTEARSLAAALTTLQSSVAEQVETSADDLIVKEIKTALEEARMAELVKGLGEANRDQLAKFAQAFERQTRAFDRRWDVRIADLDDLLNSLSIIRNAQMQAPGASLVPPAYVNGAGR